LNIVELRRLLLVTFAALVVAMVAAVIVAIADDDSAGENGLAGPAINSPRIGDHWHAAYSINICGARRPNIPTFTGPEGIHTHGDGIIHMHPFILAGEVSGAAIGKFFEYGGGQLTTSSLRIPGSSDTQASGRIICDGEPASLSILRADSGIHPLGSGFSEAIQACDTLPASDYEAVTPAYIPQDGDCIRIVLAPE